MNARRLLQISSLAVLSLAPALETRAQCTNTTQYPSVSIVPDGGGALTTISTCSFQIEYSVVTSIIAGATYQFTISDGTFITVHQGSNTGPVLGFGTSPVTVAAITAEDLFPTWNVDAACNTATNCLVTTVQLFLNCTPPIFSQSTTNDCPNSVYYIDVNISSIGDATSVNLTYSVDGGAPTTQTGLLAGTYTIGPFPNTSIVDITVEHADDPTCNQTHAGITNLPCPIVSCGPDNYTYCYQNSDEYIRVYQGTSTFPLRLQFNGGTMYQFDGDVITIYDGLDDQGGILYSGTGINGLLDGVFVTSTNPDFALTLKLTSTQFTSCGDGWTSDILDWTVGCLDCTPPAGTAGVVTTDCATQEYTVSVTVSDLGTDPELEIGNDLGAPGTLITAPGTYTAGPFQVGNAVTLSLINDANSLCNVSLGTFENSYCPIQITCGEPAFEDSYCYLNGDYQFWLYQNTGPESLALLFSQGQIESDTWDHLNIYDGPDNTYPTLFSHDLNYFTEDLTGVLAISTGTSIYMEMSTDGSVSCSSGSFIEWMWTVGCLDCTQPDADYDVVLDCDSQQWYIATTIADVGSDPSIMITNTYGAPDIPVTAPGTYNSGPFPYGAVVRVDVLTDVNTLCSVHSQYTTNPPCPQVDCGPSQYTYCYPNYADTAIVYQSANTYPIAMIFNTGQMDLYGDSIYVYDGDDYLSPLLYSGFNNGDLSQLLFTSSNPENALLLKIRSNFYNSCIDLGYVPMDWSVSCLDCTNPDVTFTMVPDCIHNGYNIVANVTNVGVNAPENLMIANSYDTDTLFNIGVGTTVVGPFPVDESTFLTVMNGANPLCRRLSETYTYPSDSCINVACEPTAGEYCYQNADTAFFTYTSGNSNPITISFEYGQLLVNDFIQIYNGLDTSAQLVYMGNQGGTVAGLEFTSNNTDNALTLLVISSQAGSCATGQGFPPLYWSVGCGLIGMGEFSKEDFAMFPNPTTGELYVRLPDAFNGAVNMDVIDVTGRLVMSERYNASAGTTSRFDMNTLNAGQYAVRISTDTWTQSHMLQVVR